MSDTQTPIAGEPTGPTLPGGTALDHPVETGPAAASDQKAESALITTAGGDLRQASLWSDAWRALRRNPVFVVAAALLALLTLVAAFPSLFTGADPRDCSLSNVSANQGPGTNGAWLGYDTQGCDYYANIIYGARVSMIIGVLVVGGSLVVGVVLGALAGFFGGWFDALMARITDIFFGLPLILGAILILNIFETRGLLQVSLALIALGWMTILRLLRSSVIGIKESDYVQAARALGASNWRIITKHILPNAIAPVLVYATISVGGIIAAEATLSFLGIGLERPSISWGLQVEAARDFVRTKPFLILLPSAALSITVLCFILLGDALRDALDPKLR